MEFINSTKFRTSKYEELTKKGFEKYGLNPKHNFQVDYFYIDFAFPNKKVGIEVDSFAWHQDIERDKRRHNFLESKGWKLYHFNTRVIATNPHIPAAYVYLKHFAEDETKSKQAKYDIYIGTRHLMSDTERTLLIKDMTS